MVRFSHDTQIVLWLDFYVIHHGVTDNMLVIEYGHETTYWQQKGHLEAEAIAHFFEVVGSGGERLKMLKTCFPFSFAYFVGFIKDI